MEQDSIESLEYPELLQKMRTNPQANQGIGQLFKCKSGDNLYYRIWPVNDPQRILVGIHGMGAHGEYYVQVADQVITNNITTYALDLKHHGRSSGKKGDIKNFKELIEQVNEFISFIKKNHNNLPIYLMGLSMGGCISVNYSIMFPDMINGLILMAPAVKTKIKITGGDILKLPIFIFTYLFRKGKPIIELAKRQDVGTRNPLKAELDKIDEFRLKNVSLRYLIQVNKWVKKAFKNVNKIICPTLIMQGTQDNLVSFDGVKKFFDKLPIKDKKFIVLEGAYHSLYSDPAMDEGGWEELKKWILNH